MGFFSLRRFFRRVLGFGFRHGGGIFIQFSLLKTNKSERNPQMHYDFGTQMFYCSQYSTVRYVIGATMISKMHS